MNEAIVTEFRSIVREDNALTSRKKDLAPRFYAEFKCWTKTRAAKKEKHTLSDFVRAIYPDADDETFDRAVQAANYLKRQASLEQHIEGLLEHTDNQQDVINRLRELPWKAETLPRFRAFIAIFAPTPAPEAQAQAQPQAAA